MNWKKISLFVAFSIFSINSFAQAGLLNAKSASEIGLKSVQEIIVQSEGPIPYGYVADKDILFGIKVWENISLSEKANEAYYYPIEEVESDGRKSLFQVLIEGIKSGNITEVYDDSDFRTKRTLKDLESSFTKIDTTDAGRQYANAGERIPDEYIQKIELRPSDVQAYHIVGLWYFDRNEGQLKYRILGIAPVIVDLYSKGSEVENYVELFWILFPDARNALFEAKVFNPKNPMNPMNFDHLLNSRRFASTIFKADNQKGNIRIDDYIQNSELEKLFEGERIKELIRNLEDDMWNY